MKMTTDMSWLSERVESTELDHQRYNHTFEGITRADVENMLKYKLEKDEADNRMQQIDQTIQYLKKKVNTFDKG